MQVVTCWPGYYIHTRIWDKLNVLVCFFGILKKNARQPGHPLNLFLLISKGKRQLCFTDKLPIYCCGAFSFSDGPSYTRHFHFKAKLVARLYLPFETAVVYACKKGEASAVFLFFKHGHSTDLRQSFNLYVVD